MTSRRRRPLGEKTKKLYADTLKRAFGDATPDYVPTLQRDDGTSWPESTRETLRAALQRHWANRGQAEFGTKLADGVEVVYEKKRKRIWPSEEEVQAFERALATQVPRVRYVIQLGMKLGLRSEGLLETKRAEIQHAVRYGRLTVLEKGQKERVLPVGADVKEILSSMLQLTAQPPHSRAVPWDLRTPWKEVGGLLAGPTSSFETRHNMLARHIKAVAAEAGVDTKLWSPHALRHVFAKRMHDRGATLRVIQEMMGHERIDTTVRYIAVTLEDMAKYMDSAR